MRMKNFLRGAVLCLGMMATANAATSTIEMLRDLFRAPTTEWREVLKESRPLLDEGFFKNVERRIRWGIENNHVDDAFRFAMVGDFAAEVKNRPANFRIDLAELFYKAGNYTMSGQIADNIRVTSPDTEPEKRATFLRAELFEVQKDLFAAHEAFVNLANRGYRPAECWYKAGQISVAIQEETRGMKELAKAKDAGSIPAGVLLEKLKNTLEGEWVAPEVIPPMENRPGIDTTTGVAAETGPDKTELLALAQAAVAEGELEQARVQYQQAYKADSQDPEILRGMAAVLYRLGSLEDALAFLNQALAAVPQDVELLRFRANTAERLFDRGKNPDHLQSALEDYSKATRLAPNHDFLPMEYKRAQSKS